jgi:hypothetical protein
MLSDVMMNLSSDVFGRPEFWSGLWFGWFYGPDYEFKRYLHICGVRYHTYELKKIVRSFVTRDVSDQNHENEKFVQKISINFYDF